MCEAKPVPAKDRLYVVVRADISPGYQIVQSCHAVEQLAVHEWNDVRDHEKYLGNTMIVLQTQNHETLLGLEYLLRVKYPNLPVEIFWEPDIAKYTAMAIPPGVLYGVDYTPLLSHLPLAGQKPSIWRRIFGR